MNQADILKLAEQSGFIVKHWPTGWVIYAPIGSDGITMTNELTRFAELFAQHEREVSGKAVEVLRELAALEILQSDANAISFAGPLSRFGDKWEDEYKKLRKEWTRRQLIVRRESEEILRAEAIRARGTK